MRRVAIAAAFSLALHALLAGLATAPGGRQATSPPETIEVELVRAASLTGMSSLGPSPGERTPRRTRVHGARGRTSTRVPEKPEEKRPVAPGPLASVASGPSLVPAAPLNGGSSELSAASTAVLATVGDPGASGETGGGPNLGAFVERLRKSAQRCSPRRVGTGGEASLARVRFCVDALGKPEAVTLLQSTGDPRLDRAALECVIPGAAPLPATDRCLVVPLRFSL
jgi:TonB family protein